MQLLALGPLGLDDCLRASLKAQQQLRTVQTAAATVKPWRILGLKVSKGPVPVRESGTSSRFEFSNLSSQISISYISVSVQLLSDRQ